jgi:hypothetical protein
MDTPAANSNLCASPKDRRVARICRKYSKIAGRCAELLIIALSLKRIDPERTGAGNTDSVADAFTARCRAPL